MDINVKREWQNSGAPVKNNFLTLKGKKKATEPISISPTHRNPLLMRVLQLTQDSTKLYPLKSKAIPFELPCLGGVNQLF